LASFFTAPSIPYFTTFFKKSRKPYPGLITHESTQISSEHPDSKGEALTQGKKKACILRAGNQHANLKI
jgi:hypothetical protein